MGIKLTTKAFGENQIHGYRHARPSVRIKLTTNAFVKNQTHDHARPSVRIELTTKAFDENQTHDQGLRSVRIELTTKDLGENQTHDQLKHIYILPEFRSRIAVSQDSLVAVDKTISSEENNLKNSLIEQSKQQSPQITL